MSAVRILERVARHAALGLRFWDIATGSDVIDGLLVEVVSRANPRSRTVAHCNRSGVYVAHGVPGLRDFEFDNGDAADVWSAATRTCRVEVRDPQERFLPVSLDADLPTRGLFTWRAAWLSPPQPIAFPGASGSPPQLMLERVPLFSTPSRPVPEPLGVVYAQLREQGSNRDAAWSLLGVSIDGVDRGLGLSDQSGRVAVMFPYPEPPRISLVSPPEERNDFTWQISLNVYRSAVSPQAHAPALADLADVFSSLTAPRVVIESDSSPAPPLRLTYREPLTVRTAGRVGADASYLFFS